MQVPGAAGPAAAPAAPTAAAPPSVVYALDARVQVLMRSSALQENGSARTVARAFNWWGGAGVIWCAVLLWLVARVARRRTLSLLGLRAVQAIAVSSALSGIAKGLGGRSRPFVAPGEPWHWSFAHGWTDARYFSMPSGHTTASFAFAMAVSAHLAGTSRARRGVVSALLILAAAGVGATRVYLNQHWLSGDNVVLPIQKFGCIW